MSDNISSILRNFKMALLKENLEVPISVEVGTKTAEKLRAEIAPMIVYGALLTKGFKHNECLFDEILIIAPSNFVWDVE